MGKGVTMTKKKKLRPKQLELSVVGLNHRVRIESMKKMERELPLKCRLEREPGNLADENAIKVILDNHSAHISRETKTWLAAQPDGRFALCSPPNTVPGSTSSRGFSPKQPAPCSATSGSTPHTS